MKQVYAVWDRVAEEIVGGLMVFTHDAPVVRIFVDGLQDPSTMLNKHPADYELWCLGEMDGPTLSGYVGGPRVVMTGLQWREINQAQAPQAEVSRG